MSPTMLKDKLIAVLSQIQAESSLECPPMTGATQPVGTLPQFDSMTWPVATTILATETGVPIPDDVNIFIDETTDLPRSIDEIVDFVSTLATKQNETEKDAA